MALKSGAIDVYDWRLRPAQLAEYNANICVNAPDAPAGILPCVAGQAPIQHEIAVASASLDRSEIDLQNQAFPSNVLGFRQAIAWATDKENFVTNSLGGLGTPIYTAMPCPEMCDSTTGQWVDSSLLTPTAQANHVYGSGLPIATRISVANTILDSLGFTVGASGFRVDNGAGCAVRVVPNG